MKKNNGLSLITDKKGYKLLDICYNKQIYLERIEKLDKNNMDLESEIINLSDEKVNLIDLKINEKRKINFEMLDKKLNRIFLFAITVIIIFFAPMIATVSILEPFLHKLIAALLCGGSLIGLLNIGAKAIENSILKKQNKALEEFNNAKGKEIDERINTIEKNIQENQNQISCNLDTIEKYEKMIQLSNYYVKQMKYLTDKMCKAKVETNRIKIYKSKEEILLKSKEKVKTLK